ncbi:MAG TPA: hypothetical protein VGQ65_20635 [Thermoanaerobaculia bacterium]|jgi:hypothetical protein|nr:hypothetical protein [Thermoanaerobaculia bacterium]
MGTVVNLVAATIQFAVSKLKLRSLVIVVALLALGAPLAAQESVCADPVDKPCLDCLTQVAQYTSGMVIPNRAGAPARLQAAIDNAYKDAQNDWSGPLRERTWIRNAYFEGIIAILALLSVVAFLRVFVRPRFWPDRPPSWTAERVTILVTLLTLTLAISGERWLMWNAMLASSDKLADAVRPFVHLRPPSVSANTESNPCSQYWSETDAMLQQCDQDWKRAAGLAKVRFKESHFTNPELLADLTAVGSSCLNVTLPLWWTNSSVDPGRYAVGSRCILTQNGNDTVMFKDIASLPTLSKWLSSAGTQSASLELEPLLRRTNTSGGNIYQTKINRLLGTDGFRYYKDNYKWNTAVWCGLPLLVMCTFVAFITIGRYKELVNGSLRWAKANRKAVRWLLAADISALLIMSIITTLQ